MQWSKLKLQIENLFCASLKGRVVLFTTWYKTGGSPDRARCAILVDKKEIFEANTDTWVTLNRSSSNTNLFDKGIFQACEFRDILQEYLTLSIEEALHSDNILIKALAIIDRRLGKRRLCQIKIQENDHYLIKLMYELRFQAERL